MIYIKLISVNLPNAYIRALESLVTNGRFPNRSEAIRVAIRDLIKDEYLIEKTIKRKLTLERVNPQIKSKVQEKLIV
ncbi:MAG: ribbon-helix-helix domain-containing protein [Promethearchaeota archaeon]